jgi:transcriptional regulator with XRE-family HTH domain
LHFAHTALSYIWLFEDNQRMKIGQVIRSLRAERGYTLERVALDVGTDASNLSRIERGLQQPSGTLLSSIAATLGTSVSAIYGALERSGTPIQQISLDEIDGLEDISNESIRLRRYFRALSPSNKILALEMIRLLLLHQPSGPL